MAPPVVATTALTRSFGSHRGIVDVDLRVERGEIFGFLGPNGAGKSTTIRILMGLYHASSGTSQVLGLDPRRDAVEVHRRTGYLPGELAVYPRLTGREILERLSSARGLRDTRYRDELVKRFGAEVDRPTQTLSKGNKQKLGIVLAFMHRPELLVLDEATSGLDPLLQQEFISLLRETAAEGRNVFLSSHDLDEVQRVVHRLAIIREGRIVVTDTVDGLRTRAPRTIELTFDRDTDTTALAQLDGVELDRTDPRSVRLTITGPVAPVLRAIAPLDPVDLLARPADLDELFLGYSPPTFRRPPVRADTALIDLRLRRRSMIWFTVGLAVYAFLIVAMYPSVKTDASPGALTTDNPTVAALLGVSGSLTAPNGWVNGNLYANFLPLMILLMTIGYGASALAGQSEDGSLGLVATLPISRRRLAAEKAGVLALLAVPLSVATMAIILLGRNYELSLPTGAVIGAALAVLVMGVDFGLIAMIVGVLTGSRGLALGLTSALAAASYLISSLAPVVGWAHTLRPASLFYWASGGHPLTDGPSTSAYVVLVLVGVTLFAAAVALIERLDIR